MSTTPASSLVPMSIGVSDFSYLYRQARRAVQGLAEPIEAPIACFTLKHVFREAAKAKDLPQEQLKALQALGELLQGVKDKFCGTMPGVEPLYEATAESDALLADVLKKIDVMAASLVKRGNGYIHSNEYGAFFSDGMRKHNLLTMDNNFFMALTYLQHALWEV